MLTLCHVLANEVHLHFSRKSVRCSLHREAGRWEEKQMTFRDLGLIISTNLILSCKVCSEVVRSLAAAQTNASDSMLCRVII